MSPYQEQDTTTTGVGSVSTNAPTMPSTEPITYTWRQNSLVITQGEVSLRLSEGETKRLAQFLVERAPRIFDGGKGGVSRS